MFDGQLAVIDACVFYTSCAMATYSANSTHLARVITCHAVAGGGSLLAICPNSPEVILLEKHNGTWRVVCRLEGHDQLISGLDFYQDRSGRLRLVSASHDRNSYVWTREPGSSSWSPELVVTKLSRAGLCTQWSPAGTKFAIGSGEKTVCVCFYDADKELWAPKLIRKNHASSVTALAWHPGGAALATASTDGCCRVFNAAIPDVDGPSSVSALGSSHFGEQLLQVGAGSWVLAVAWSPGGDTLAFCCQDSTLSLLWGIDLSDPTSLGAAAAGRQRLQLPGLPLRCLVFLSNSLLVGAGFDHRPLLLRRRQGVGGEWQLVSLEAGEQHAGSSGAAQAKDSSLSARIQMFESQVAKPRSPRGNSAVPGGSSNGKSSSSNGQPHSNCITCISPLGGGGWRFLTTGVDGKVVEWLIEL